MLDSATACVRFAAGHQTTVTPYLPKHTITRNDREFVLEGLCHEHAIERIAVMKRQIRDSNHMP